MNQDLVRLINKDHVKTVGGLAVALGIGPSDVVECLIEVGIATFMAAHKGLVDELLPTIMKYPEMKAMAGELWDRVESGKRPRSVSDGTGQVV